MVIVRAVIPVDRAVATVADRKQSGSPWQIAACNPGDDSVDVAGLVEACRQRDRQPVLRAELEAIRGVACGEVLRSLMERRLVSIVGRSEDLGRPMLYGTTRQFLEVFGLSSLEDLPEVPGLERRRPPRPVAATPAEESEDVIEAGEAGEPDPGAAEAPEGSVAGLTAAEDDDRRGATTAGAGDGADEVAGVTPESGV